jgi:hypothetical protein
MSNAEGKIQITLTTTTGYNHRERKKVETCTDLLAEKFSRSLEFGRQNAKRMYKTERNKGMPQIFQCSFQVKMSHLIPARPVALAQKSWSYSREIYIKRNLLMRRESRGGLSMIAARGMCLYGDTRYGQSPEIDRSL